MLQGVLELKGEKIAMLSNEAYYKLDHSLQNA
jgi:hypothetical protein